MYHGMSGKLVGLGADEPAEFPINEQSVAFLAAMECQHYANLTSLSASMLQLLASTFLGVPPAGVTKGTFDAFTLRAMQCNLYALPGSVASDEWLREEMPLPTCLNDDIISVLSYGKKYGYEGNQAEKNMLYWLATKSPNNMYLYDLVRVPPCHKTCHNRYHAGIVMRCLADPEDSICESTPALKTWFEKYRDQRLCPTFGGYMRDEIDSTECSDVAGMVDLDYCAQHGYQGPDPIANSECWLLWAAKRMQPTIDRCAPPAPEPAPEPAPAPTDTTTAPLFPAPTTTAAPVDTAPAPVDTPAPMVAPAPLVAPAPPPEEEKMSAATMGIIGVLGLAAVGGIVLATRKKKR